MRLNFQYLKPEMLPHLEPYQVSTMDPGSKTGRIIIRELIGQFSLIIRKLILFSCQFHLI